MTAVVLLALFLIRQVAELRGESGSFGTNLRRRLGDLIPVLK